MSVNKSRPHLFVLPEDDANLRIATGFALAFPTRQIQRLPVAGGWSAVLSHFKAVHVSGMDRFTHRLMALLIDFDGQSGRFDDAKLAIPERLMDRVFVLGAWTEPEDLKTAGLGHYETIGRALAQDCLNNTNAIWGHDLLKHNAGEVARFRELARPILFP